MTEYLHVGNGWRRYEQIIIAGIPAGCYWWIGYDHGEPVTLVRGIGTGDTVVTSIHSPVERVTLRVIGNEYLPVDMSMRAVDSHILLSVVKDRAYMSP